MLISKAKARYFLTSAARAIAGARSECPSCGHPTSVVVDRKYLVTTLRRCLGCSLLFRAPTSTPAEQDRFYQLEYDEGFTTEVPPDGVLQHYLEREFRNTEKDYSQYLAALDALGARTGDRVLDFGCSWGYGSWQLREHGYEVQCFEISRPRATFAREKLGLSVHTSMTTVLDACDVFFSAHVLEHVPSVSMAFGLASKVLKPGGLFVAFTPNGSEAYKLRAPNNWHLMWGLVHPNMLDDIYYRTRLAESPFVLASNPYDLSKLAAWSREPGSMTLDLRGEELLVAFRH